MDEAVCKLVRLFVSVRGTSVDARVDVMCYSVTCRIDR